MKLKRRETSNCCQREIHWKKSSRKNRMKPANLKRLCRYSKRKEKISNGQLEENLGNFIFCLYYSLEQSCFSWKDMLLLLYHCLCMLQLTFGFKILSIQDRQGKMHYNLRYIREKYIIFIELVRSKQHLKITSNL